MAHSPITPNIWAHHEGLQPLTYDPDAARRALSDAGWTDSDGDGIRDRDGKPFRFDLLTNAEDPLRRNITVMVQEQLKRVGIDARPTTMEFNSMMGPLSRQEFDAVMSLLSLSTDLDLSYYFHTRAIGNAFNWGAFSNPDVDGLIDEIAAELGVETRAESRALSAFAGNPARRAAHDLPVPRATPLGSPHLFA